jgi:hypothetical protein
MPLFEGIAALLAKVASASAVAQATAGLGIAVVGVTGAGAAGVLPGALQDGVADAVEAVSPFELPHSDERIGDHRTSTEADDASVDGPATVPAVTPALPSPVHATTAHVEHGPEVEDHGAEGVEDGTHQHRGGRTATAPSDTTSGSDDDSADTSPEVEDHHGADDSGHGGGSDSGDDSGGDDHSGHGGGDDD